MGQTSLNTVLLYHVNAPILVTTDQEYLSIIDNYEKVRFVLPYFVKRLLDLFKESSYFNDEANQSR